MYRPQAGMTNAAPDGHFTLPQHLHPPGPVLAWLQSHTSGPGSCFPGTAWTILGGPRPTVRSVVLCSCPPQAELSCVLCLQRRRAAASG